MPRPADFQPDGGVQNIRRHLRPVARRTTSPGRAMLLAAFALGVAVVVALGLWARHADRPAHGGGASA